MNICYVCEKTFNEIDVIRHDEHIIQNAIGGKLTSPDILCEACGGKLGGAIDGPFGDHLKIFSVLHGASRDRGDAEKAAIKVTSSIAPRGGSKAITYSLNNDFTITPDRPIYFLNEDQKLVTVCCSVPKQVQTYIKSPEIESLVNAGYRLEIQTNMAQFVASSAVQIEPDSTEVLRGIAKIAIEYALYCGLPFESVKIFKEKLIVSCDETYLRAVVMQYYPVSDEEKLYETGKFLHEDYYPNHQLFLFSRGSDVYCYVELFGAIQKYVHLSNTFSGSFRVNKFLQKITSWGFCESDWQGDPKDLHVMAGQFGIPFSGRSLLQVERDIINHARKRPYEIDADDQIEKVKNLVHNLVLYVVSDIKGFESVDELLQKADEAKTGLEFALVDRLRQDKLHAMQWIYKNFEWFRIKSNDDFCPDVVSTTPFDDLQKYAAFKLYETMCSIDREHEINFLLPQREKYLN